MSLFSFSSKKQTEATSVQEALAGTMSQSSAKSKNRKSAKDNGDSEQLVPEKKRARRRLIGAIVMVLAVIIGLPMMLDSEPQVINKNIAIQIPTKAESASLSESQEKMAEEVAEVDISEQASRIPSSETVSQTAAAKTKLASSKPSVTEVAPLVSSSTTSKLKKEPSAKNVSESTRALAILNDSNSGLNSDSTVSAKTSTKNSTRIVVQVGAFATQEKVNELRSKLTSVGIKSFTQKVTTSSGSKIRVRIGPFDDKEAADKVKNKIDKLGLNSKMIFLE